MSSEAVIELLDGAPVFAEQPALSAEDLRRAGLAELTCALAQLKAAEGEAREPSLRAIAEQLGQLVGAGAIVEAFAKASLEDAAAGAGLIRDMGAKPVKAAIAAGIKTGKKSPRDVSAMQGIVAATFRGDSFQSQLRPGEAGNSAAVLLSSFREEGAPPGAARPARAAAPAAAEAPETTSSQTGASFDDGPFGGGAGGDAEVGSDWSGGGDDGEPPSPEEDDNDRNLRLAALPMTDLGNVERFFARYRGKFLWCQVIGWLVWDGKRYSRAGSDAAVMLAEHATVRAIQDEADAIAESGLRGEVPGGRDFVYKIVRKEPVLFSEMLAGWGRISESANKLGALSSRGRPYFAVDIEALDADKFKINVNNGTLVIRRVADQDYISFQPHDPADFITKLAPVDFDPTAHCPTYDAFLARVQPDEKMRDFIHRWFGLSLTGDTTEQKLAFFYGKGGNGKSVLQDTVGFIAGDYGETVPIETFLDNGKARGGGQATPDLAILPGVRALRTSEPEKNAKLAEAMIKLVTGGEPILARHLNRDFFRFYPQFKLTIGGNYRPTISGADEGIWRRMQLVPFNVIIPKDERDPHLVEKLRSEASGILNRLLDGLRVWLDKGLQEPDEVIQATADYRDASDPLGRFLASCVIVSAGDRVQSSSLYQLYEAWCVSSGETAWKQRGFSMAMDERGFKRKQSDVMWWLDMKAIKSVNDFVDHEGKPLRMRNDGGGKVEEGDMEF